MIDPKEILLKEGLLAFKESDYNGIALLPTGTGKGKLMIEIAKLLNPKSILYVCNSVLLRDKMFKDELMKWNAAYLLNRMDLACYQTTTKWVGKHFDLVLGDEFDAALTPKYIKTFTNNTFKNKILVSATLDEAKRRKALKIAPIVFERKPVETQGIVTNGVSFYFINYNLSPQENAQYLAFNIRFKKLLNSVRTKEVNKQLDWLKIERKQFLSKLKTSLEVTKWLMESLKPKHEKILVFTGLSEQADKISKYSFHSNNDNDHYFNSFDEGKILELAVVDKVNRGLNINDIRNIIFESVGKSKTKITQRIGRGCRLDIQELLNVFFLVPYFMDMWGNRKPTIVRQWIIDSCEDMNLSGAKTIQYKK